MAQSGQVARIEVRQDDLDVTTVGGDIFRSRKESSVSVLELLEQRGGSEGVQILVKDQGTNFLGIFLSLLPLMLVGALIFFMVRGARGGINQAMSIGRSKARVAVLDKPAVRFSDVAGVTEAKEELAEIVQFLSYLEKFSGLGAKIPKGVLLAGPPGTGKTLISRAVAGEAEVPFFSISGSEFVEMFVGVGASRVRDLFARAKQSAPAIVFVDEIDAVGRHRGAGIGGGNDEREQTLNQILVEMDGFDERTNLIVIAATNRPDVLDPALLRPGRFDRRVVLDLPDLRGRGGYPEGPPAGQASSARCGCGNPGEADPQASAAPTWPTWSTRVPSWRPGRTGTTSPSGTWRRRWTVSSQGPPAGARRSASGSGRSSPTTRRATRW